MKLATTSLVAVLSLSACPAPGNLTITTSTVPPGNVDAAYDVPLETEGGTAPLHFEVTEGDLPAGIDLDADTGELRGTPTEAGVLPFTVRAGDAGGARAEQSLLLRVFANPPPRITTTALRSAVVGRPYSLGLQAVDGKPPFTWSKGAGALVAGLSLEPSGLVDGSATATGTSQVELVATDANAQQARATFAIAAYLEVAVAPATLPDATASSPYSVTFQASGGLPPYRYTLAGGSLPDGVSLDAAGHLAGTPALAGTWMFSVQVHDESGQAPGKLYALVVN
ncbi:MAG TPA: Ig domain-containing protein [Myxococcaceae bacterium]